MSRIGACEDSSDPESDSESACSGQEEDDDCVADVFRLENPKVTTKQLQQYTRSLAKLKKCHGPTQEIDEKTKLIGGESAIIIDPGTGFIKAGVNTVHTAPITYHNVVGRPKPTMTFTVGIKEDVRYLERGWMSRDLCNFTYPIERGLVSNWDDMEQIYKNIIDDLQKNSCKPLDDLPIMITDQPLNPAVQREKLMELMFEDLGITRFYVAVPAVLALYSTGRTTGCVLDSGSAVTYTVPVSEGKTLACNINRISVGGEDITRYLMRLVQSDLVDITSFNQRCALACAKERLCFVSLDYEKDMCASDDCNLLQKFIMEDTNNMGEVTVTVSKQRFRAPEALFKPGLLGKMHMPIHEAVYDSIKKTQECLQRILFGNIVLSGGNTLFPNLECRLERELKILGTNGAKVHVLDDVRRKHAVWIGGSILASMQSFEPQWITKKEYEEEGLGILAMKCF